MHFLNSHTLGMIVPFLIFHQIRADPIIATNSTSTDVVNNSSISSSDCTNALKLEHLNHALNRIDGAVQSLEEKAHNWAIFRHHIDAWNEQIKAVEHKLDLVRRTQDEQQAFGNKFISLEFTLNHILSKVVYLSDTCNAHQIGATTIRSPTPYNTHARMNTNGNDNEHDTIQQQNQETKELLYEHIALLGDVKHAIDVDRQLRGELSSRLNNILRHVQNIERDNCRGERRQPTTNGNTNGGNTNSKVAKLMAPIGGCNSSQNIERSLKSLDQQISRLTTRTSAPKDLKQLQTLTRKNSQQLEKIINWMSKVDEQLLQWRDDSAIGWHQCQTMSGELTTFTESSDLLLKRIEFLLHEVNESKMDKTKSTKKADDDANEDDEDAVESEDTDEVDRKRIADEEESDKESEGEVEEDMSTTNVVVEDIDGPTDVGVEVQTEKIDDGFEVVDFSQPEKTACHELHGPSIDGVYKFSTPELNEAGRDSNQRYCAFATDDGPAWTVIQNRGPFNEHENFNRSWLDYKHGFGELNKEFWYGNEFIHQVVDRDDYKLRIELTDFDNEHVWAEYSLFRMDSESYNYNLLIGGYSGTAPDAMHYHNEMDFSTYDRRNDKSVDACCACASGYGSGWWFDNCSEANLNGIYRETPKGHNYVGIIWEQWRGDYSLFKTRMLIRPKKLSKEEANHDGNKDYSEDP
ncbi:angiopoietin-2 [Ceratitis capitata]|uniref:angiopoietin-2 n=1 Tax=Ceratitis capitata TaxID=7213 RepID=UPI000A116614|nr:angiopoietin-2 [Ceratitis capitata]